MPHKLPPGVTRGPDGQFVSTGEAGQRFDDIEVVPFGVTVTGDGHTSGSDTLDWRNVTNFEGFLLLDLDQLLDRHRVAHLIYSELAITVTGVQTPGNQWQLTALAELSGSPSLQAADLLEDGDLDVVGDTAIVSGDMDDVSAAALAPDTLDVPMRPVQASASGGFEDETNGTGAGGTYDHDRAYGPVPGTWDFDRRDEIYVNGTLAHAGGFAGTLYSNLWGILAFGIEDE